MLYYIRNILFKTCQKNCYRFLRTELPSSISLEPLLYKDAEVDMSNSCSDAWLEVRSACASLVLHVYIYISVCVCVICSEPTVCQRLFARVCRTAAPLQLLMMLLLGVAWLLPLIQHCDDAFDCRRINNIRRSLDGVLTYPDGSPPVWIKSSYWPVTCTMYQKIDATNDAPVAAV